MFKNNDKLRKVMLITAAIGITATIAYVIIFSMVFRGEDTKLMTYVALFPAILWVLGYLVIGYGFKWKFGKDVYWVATLFSFPCMFEILTIAIIGQSSIDCMLSFVKWYSMIGITISVLIFEYKFMTHGKK